MVLNFKVNNLTFSNKKDQIIVPKNSPLEKNFHKSSQSKDDLSSLSLIVNTENHGAVSTEI